MLNPTLSRYCVLSCHHRGSSGRDAPYPALHDDAQGVVVPVPLLDRDHSHSRGRLSRWPVDSQPELVRTCVAPPSPGGMA